MKKIQFMMATALGAGMVTPAIAQADGTISDEEIELFEQLRDGAAVEREQDALYGIMEGRR